MTGQLRSVAKHALMAAGHYRRRLGDAPFPGIAVLCYHGVRPDLASAAGYPFEQLHVRAGELQAHCELLARVCTPIGLDDLRRSISGGAPLPPRAVLVTFDDGYRSVARLAAPILERHRIPAAFFVCAGSIADRRLLWYDAVARRGDQAGVARMKRLPFDQWQRIDGDTRTIVGDDDPMAAMTVDDLRALAARPLFEIGGHTISHPILANAPAGRQREEIAGSLRAIESWIGKPVRSFAYPNGEPGVDYTSDTVALVRDAGIDVAFTTHAGFAGSGEPALEQSRFMMLAGVSQAELAHRLTYSWRRVA
jgi:peptidoglycan/xylan/chitin deacetylase (PgdA/CDA1 family)